MAESMAGARCSAVIVLVIEHYRRAHHRAQQLRWLDSHSSGLDATSALTASRRNKNPRRRPCDLLTQ